MRDQKYYWLKLHRDFFKRHDIQIIEDMPNGKDYILFYLKLLVESIDHEGELRFSDTIPYNEEMLATITRTNVDIVRAAMKVFTELGMITIYADATIYMSEVAKMIGCETKWAEKKRRQRVDNVPLMSPACPPNVRQEIEIEKEIDIDKEKDKKSRGFVKPTVEEVRAYCQERNNNIDPERFVDFYEMKGWMIGKNKMKDWKAAVRTWEKRREGEQPNDRVGRISPEDEEQRTREIDEQIRRNQSGESDGEDDGLWD